MAYDKEEIFEEAKHQIIENKLFFIEDVVAFLPCGKTYFYDAFPVDSNEMNTIKELLDDNKVTEKVAIRKKLKSSDKAAELLALYRLLATPEEHQKLNQSYIDHSTKGEKLHQPILTNDPLSNDTDDDGTQED